MGTYHFWMEVQHTTGIYSCLQPLCPHYCHDEWASLLVILCWFHNARVVAGAQRWFQCCGSSDDNVLCVENVEGFASMNMAEGEKCMDMERLSLDQSVALILV